MRGFRKGFKKCFFEHLILNHLIPIKKSKKVDHSLEENLKKTKKDFYKKPYHEIIGYMKNFYSEFLHIQSPSHKLQYIGMLFLLRTRFG